ncbi:MAG TPA: succinate dehydrogenase, hydrophobic membrane anchor protein [Gammaproteobacteria bacterium]|nr:succinate dehydrogenase, hydrophobic membrane anchor protein [Gammaproteobacteria bacterium]
MLNLTTALGRNGLQDWIIQRVTAAILAVYSIFLFIFWLCTARTYDAWVVLFNIGVMRFMTVVALTCLIAHAWIGLWIICTDYIKSAGMRIAVLICIYMFLLFDVIWAIQILWGL